MGTPLFSLVEPYPSEFEKVMDAKDARSGSVDIETSSPLFPPPLYGVRRNGYREMVCT